MNIVVLAGGNSTEREVSIVSGKGVCGALRERNHRAILLDAYFGREKMEEDLFPAEYDIEKEAAWMQEKSKLLKETMKTRREFFGPYVLDICRAADIVFLALHGANGEDGKVQSVLDLMGIPYTGSGHLSSAMAMEDVAVVLITETLLQLCPDLVYDLKLNQKRPLIVEIPDRHGNGRTKDSITRYVREAIGVKI